MFKISPALFLIFTAVCAVAVFAIFQNQAQGITIDLIGGNPIKCTDLTCVFNKIADGLLIVAVPLAAIMIVIGGVLIFTAGGNAERYEKGRQAVAYAIIGFVVVVLAKSIASILQNFFP